MELVEDGCTVVLDIGHNTVRIGCSQDAAPKVEIPSHIGVLLNNSDSLDVGEASGSFVIPVKKYVLGHENLSTPRAGLEMLSFLKDCMIDDWELFEKLLDYVYDKCLQIKPEMHPILFSEAPWNVKDKRENLAEIMFEKYKVPAFFIVKNAALTTFANRRTTALVIDSGATHTSAVPVQDGFVLSRGIVRTPLAGEFLTSQCGQLLKGHGIDIVPPYMVATKECVEKNEESKWMKHSDLPEVTTTWHNFTVRGVLQDFQSKVLEASRSPLHDESYTNISPICYEFPDGYSQDFTKERIQLPEALFNPELFQLGSSMGVGHIVRRSVLKCEADVRASLYNNVIISGGNSLLKGFPERLCNELAHRTPSSMRLKVIHGGKSRRVSSWIGGSIVASLGTFPQMCVSSREYEEGGKNVIEKKCP